MFLRFVFYFQLCSLLITNSFVNMSPGLIVLKDTLINTKLFQWHLTFSTHPLHVFQIESLPNTQTGFLKMCNFCETPVLIHNCTQISCSHIKVGYKNVYRSIKCKLGTVTNASLSFDVSASSINCDVFFTEIECLFGGHNNCSLFGQSLVDKDIFLSFDDGNKSENIIDFEGALIPVAVMDYIPFFIVNNSKLTDGFDGVEYQMIEEMARKLNFSPHYLVYDSWVHELVNDTWHGGVGQAMQEGEADIAFASIWQILSLARIMDFGPSFAMTKLTFLVRRPKQKFIQWNTILNIFGPKVWTTTIAAFFVVTALYKVGGQLDPRKDHFISWETSLLNTLGRLTVSSFHSTVDTLATRIILTSWSIFCLLITSAFFSGILIRFTLPVFTARIDTVKQLVEGDYYWSAQYYKKFQENIEFKESMFNLQNSWENQFEKRYTYMEPEEVEAAVRYDEKITFPAQLFAGDMVIIDTQGVKESSRALSKFRVCKGGTTENHITFGVKKCSPLLEPLSALAHHFSEAGLLHFWKRSVIRRRPEYDSRQFLVERDIATFSEPQQFHLYNLRPLFFLLLFGLFLASLTFIVEIFCYGHKKT